MAYHIHRHELLVRSVNYFPIFGYPHANSKLRLRIILHSPLDKITRYIFAMPCLASHYVTTLNHACYLASTSAMKHPEYHIMPLYRHRFGMQSTHIYEEHTADYPARRRFGMQPTARFHTRSRPERRDQMRNPPMINVKEGTDKATAFTQHHS